MIICFYIIKGSMNCPRDLLKNSISYLFLSPMIMKKQNEIIIME